MSRSSKRSLFLFFIVFLVLLVGLTFTRRAGNNFSTALKNVNQNTLAYLNAQTANQLLLSIQQQQLKYQDFLQHYFSPWAKQPIMSSYTHPKLTMEDFKKTELEFIEQFTSDPGYGVNRQKYSQVWINNIVANANMKTFPNGGNKNGITITATNLRSLPSDDPSFADWQKAGEGYPFDYFQNSIIPANSPVKILQISKDYAWSLVLSINDIGWVHSQNIALVDDIFKEKWTSGRYFAFTKDNVPIIDTQHHFYFLGRIGSIFPLSKLDNCAGKLPCPLPYTIQIAVKDANDNAVIKTVNIKQENGVILPLLLTQKNIAKIAENMIGVFYGWGDLLGYRDCSSTMLDLFTPFGIWLPRNSIDQAQAGQFISLQGMSEKQKLKIINSQGIPFFTFLDFPGHIVLYIGNKNNQGYLFQNFWGIHTNEFFGKPGRAIVGKTAITPIDLGKGYLNTSPFVDRADGMTVLK